MSLTVKLAGGAKPVSGAAVLTAGGLKNVKEMLVRTATGVKKFFSTLAVTLSSYEIAVARNSAGTVGLTSFPVIATPVGGQAPFTYLWSRVAPDAHAWSINNGTTASATFSTTAAAGASWVAQFKCTVTDAAGNSADSDVVEVTASNNYFGGGGGGGGGPYP